MSRKTDLEQSIRESYSLIREYEDIIRLSDRPKEKLRAKREIEEQWGLIEGYLVEYLPLAGEDIPGDIEQVSQRAQSWEEDLDKLAAQAVFGSWEERRAYRNRQVMIERVRQAWIGGVLEQSLYHVARLELGLEEQPDVVERTVGERAQETKRAKRILSPGMQMNQVFDDLGEALLILGAPGTGKTTMLLELARDLLDRAEREASHPLPVVFSLSSWTIKRKVLTDWLVDELNALYSVPRKDGQVWVQEDHILPLLDGLDEVAPEHREACVKAINAYRQEHGFVGIAVCCRQKEYEELAGKLHLESAVAVQPLARDQVDAYLEQAGAPLAGVREALTADETLYELLDTPLMLSVVMMTYRDQCASALQAIGTAQERREQLFSVYTDAMFERRSVQERYTRQQTEHWLAWLATEMSRHNQTALLIEGLQPSWISVGTRRGVYVACSRMADGLVVGLLYGLIVGFGRLSIDLAMGRRARLVPGLMAGAVVWLLFGLIGGLGAGIVNAVSFARQDRDTPMPTRWRSAVHVLAVGLVFGFLYGLTFGLDLALRAGVVWGLIAGFMNALGGGLMYMLIGAPILGIRSGRQSLAHDIQPVEALKWWWPEAGKGGAWGAAAGLLGGFLVRQGFKRFGIGAVRGSWVDSVVCFALVGALFGGLRGRTIERKTVPNYGIKLSARNAAFAGLVSALIAGLISGLTARWSFGWSGLLLSVLFGVLFGGLLGALWYGGLDAINHVVLRLVLCLDGCIPWNYARFLDYATERIFLRKVGGGYIYIHRLLQDYFAELWERE